MQKEIDQLSFKLKKIPLKELKIVRKSESNKVISVSGNVQELGNNEKKHAQKMCCFNENEWQYSLKVSQNFTGKMELQYLKGQYDNNNFFQMFECIDQKQQINVIQQSQSNTCFFQVSESLQRQENELIKQENETVYLYYEIHNENGTILDKYEPYQKLKMNYNKKQNIWTQRIPIPKYMYGTIRYKIFKGEQENSFMQKELESEQKKEIIVLDSKNENSIITQYIKNEGAFHKLSEMEVESLKKLVSKLDTIRKQIGELQSYQFSKDQYIEEEEIFTSKKNQILKYGQFPSTASIQNRVDILIKFLDQIGNQVDKKQILLQNIQQLKLIFMQMKMYILDEILSKGSIQNPTFFFGLVYILEIQDLDMKQPCERKLKFIRFFYSNLSEPSNLSIENKQNLFWKDLCSIVHRIIETEVYKKASRKFYEELYENQPFIDEDKEIIEFALQHMYFLIAEQLQPLGLHGKNLKSGDIMIIIKEQYYQYYMEDQVDLKDIPLAHALITFFRELKHFLPRYYYFYWNCSEKKGEWQNPKIKQYQEKIKCREKKKEGGFIFDIILFGEEILNLGVELSKYLLDIQNWKNHERFQKKIKECNGKYIKEKDNPQFKIEQNYAQKCDYTDGYCEQKQVIYYRGYCGQHLFEDDKN